MATGEGSNRDKTQDAENDESVVNLKRTLTLFSGVALNVGSVIGSGIFVSPKGVLAGAGSVGMTLIVWILCGIFSLIGGLCFAELGCMIPSQGGIYIYVHYAFGSFWSFLIQWVSFVMIQPSSVAVQGLTLGSYIIQPFYPDLECPPPFAIVRMIGVCAIILVSMVNCWSVPWSALVQDTLTIWKSVALIIIIITGLVYLGKGHTQSFADPFVGTTYKSIGVAFYAGLFAYTGWYSLNIVIEELINPYRNLPRAIIISITFVTVVYVLTNVAYFAVLSPADLLASNAVAVTFAERTLGWWAWIIPVSVAMSVFGALNGNIIIGSRISFAGAREKQLPNFLGMISINRKTPSPSVILNCIFALVYMMVDDIFSLINYLSFVTWTVVGMATFALLWLRWKEPDKPRPYRVHIIFPIIFLLACIFLVIMGVIGAPIDTAIGLAIACTGIPVYFLTVRPTKLPDWLKKVDDAFTRFVQRFLIVVNEETKKPL